MAISPKAKVWMTIRQHRGWVILGSLLIFLLWGFPLGIATAWPALVRDKTLPEWLAANGWRSLTTLTIAWITLAALVTLVGVVSIIVLSLRDRSGLSKDDNAQPTLVGRIDCLEVDIDWDTELFGVHEENKCLLKASFTLRVALWNESAAPTTISGFQLRVLWEGGHDLAAELPVENYSVRYSIPRSEEWGREMKCRRLVAFRQDVEITNTNHQTGDLRFLARAIPSASESSDERPIVRDDVIFRLEALDRKRERHKIYEGTWNGLPECGSVERDREYFGLELNRP